MKIKIFSPDDGQLVGFIERDLNRKPHYRAKRSSGTDGDQEWYYFLLNASQQRLIPHSRLPNKDESARHFWHRIAGGLK